MMMWGGYEMGGMMWGEDFVDEGGRWLGWGV